MKEEQSGSDVFELELFYFQVDFHILESWSTTVNIVRGNKKISTKNQEMYNNVWINIQKNMTSSF